MVRYYGKVKKTALYEAKLGNPRHLFNYRMRREAYSLLDMLR